MSRGLPSRGDLAFFRGPGAARPVGGGRKIFRRCPTCEAAPGHRCTREVHYEDGPAYIPLKTLHRER